MDNLDLFQTREMTQAVNEFKPVGSFFRSTFFGGGTDELHNTKDIDIDIFKGKRKVAPYTKRTAKSTPFARDGFKTGKFEIPYIKLNRTLAAADRILAERGIGENIYSGRTKRDRAAEIIAKDMMELEVAIQRTEELQAAQAICNGEIIVQGEEVDALIDFDRDTDLEFTVDAADYWDASTADISAQLRTYTQLIHEKSGFTPNVLIFGKNVMDAFMNNENVLAKLDNRRINSGGGINTTASNSPLPSARFYGNWDGFDIWEYFEMWLDPSDLTDKLLVPEDSIIIASQGMMCKRHYGPIEDFGALIPLRRFAKSWMENDPSVHIGMLQSSPAFINHNPDATAKIKVLA